MKNQLVKGILKGSLITALSGLVLLMIFAGIFTITGSNKNLNFAINIFIRVAGACIFSKFLCDEKRGLLKGILSGIMSFFVLELVFLLFGGLKFNLNLLIELLFSIIFGGISGIIFTNFKK